MNDVGGQTNLDEASRVVPEHLPSFLPNAKKDEVIFFRMETPSQLEKEYQFGQVLGEGTFGVVFRGIRKKDQALCAIKKILRERNFSASERARLDREISILRLVKHPGIIELFAVAESPSILFLITELCEGGSLATRLESLPEGSGLDEYVVVEIIRQVASALSYLHNRGIIHRDLKAGNIMLLNKVFLCSRVISRSDRLDSIRGGTNDVPRIGASQIAEQHPIPALTAPTVPVITDYQITERSRKKTSVTPRASVRSKNSRASSKHQNLSLLPPSTNGMDKLSYQQQQSSTPQNQQQQQQQQQQYHYHQQQQQYSIRKMNPSTSLPNSANRGGRLSAREVSIPVKLAPSELRTKLIDFGLAIEVRKNEEVLADPCGTPLYMAPEVLTGRSYTRQCDVWSLGILMYQLLTNQVPYNAQNEDQLLEQLLKFDVDAVVGALDFLSMPAQECLIRVLNTDPAYRYSASELLLDPWITMYSRKSQEEIFDHPETAQHSSQELQADSSGRISTGFGQPDNQFTSRPPSVGVSTSFSTYSATNVLELMKQYHKELTGNKQDAGGKLKPTDTT